MMRGAYDNWLESTVLCLLVLVGIWTVGSWLFKEVTYVPVESCSAEYHPVHYCVTNPGFGIYCYSNERGTDGGNK